MNEKHDKVQLAAMERQASKIIESILTADDDSVDVLYARFVDHNTERELRELIKAAKAKSGSVNRHDSSDAAGFSPSPRNSGLSAWFPFCPNLRPARGAPIADLLFCTLLVGAVGIGVILNRERFVKPGKIAEPVASAIRLRQSTEHGGGSPVTQESPQPVQENSKSDSQHLRLSRRRVIDHPSENPGELPEPPDLARLVPAPIPLPPVQPLGPPEDAGNFPTQPGVYCDNAGEWVGLSPEVVRFRSVSINNVVGFGKVEPNRVYGTGTAGIHGEVDVIQSPHVFTTPPASILVYPANGVSYSDYRLVRLRRSSKGRGFQFTVLPKEQQNATDSQDSLPFQITDIRDGIQEILLPRLTVGDYGLLPFASLSSPGGHGAMFTFRVAVDEVGRTLSSVGSGMEQVTGSAKPAVMRRSKPPHDTSESNRTGRSFPAR